MTYEIYTFGGGEMLRDLFNGIAAVVGDSSYVTLAKIFGLFGLAWVLIKIAFGEHVDNMIRWIIIFFITLNVLLVPKSSVLITDRIIGGMQYAVDNVPFGLAFFASYSSLIGNGLTELTESVFTMPDDFKYHESGTLMAGSIVRTASQFRITDAQLSSDIRSFVQQCVQYDILLGKYTLEDILMTNNIWGLITENPSPARAFMYKGGIETCANGAGLLQSDWAEESDRSLSLYGIRLFGDYLNNDEAKQELAQYLPISYSYMLNLSETAQEIMQQNMMINAFEEGILGSAAQVNAPAAVQNYAETRSMQQQRSAYQLTGEMAEHWLPIMKNVFEAVLYGSFILLFPLMLLPIGVSVMKNYILSLFWLQTWAPLYAILNMVMTFFSQNKTLSAGATQDGYALSIATLPGIEQVNVDMSAIAGYLAMSIPFLSYYLIKSGAAGFSQLASHLGNLNQSAVMHGAEEATSGNYSAGNVNLQNWNAYNTSAHHTNDNLSYQSGMTSMQTDTGAMIHHTQDGTAVIESGHAISNIPTSINFSDSLRSTYTAMSEKSIQSAMTKGEQLAQTQSEMYRDLYDLSQNYGKSQNIDDSISSSQSQSNMKAFSEYQNLVDTFAERENISTSQANTALGSASLGLGLPEWSGFKLSAKGDISSGYTESSEKAYNAAHDYIQATNFNEVAETAVRASQDVHYRGSSDVGNRLSESINSSYETSSNLRSDIGASLQQAESYREAASLSKEESSNISTVANQQFVDHLAKDMGSITAAEQLLTRNPAAAHKKAEEFVQTHYAEILEQSARQGGLGSSAQVQKQYDGHASTINQSGSSTVQQAAEKGSKTIQQKGEALKEFSVPQTLKEQKGNNDNLKKTLDMEEKDMTQEGVHRKETFINKKYE